MKNSFLYKSLIFIFSLILTISAFAQAEYEHLIMYGQSLSTGQQSGTTVSSINIPGNYMLGDQVWMNCGNTNLLTLNPLIGKASVCAPNDIIETPIYGVANHLQSKGLIQNIIATSAGASGTSIEELSKESMTAFNYNTYSTTLSAGLGVAKKNRFNIHCPAIFYLQGENNYSGTGAGLTTGTTATTNKDQYKTLLITLKNNMQADAQKVYKQTDAPTFYIYQTGAQWTRGKELTIGMAQLEASNECNDIICAGPVYPMTDYGGHLDANGYRWYGEMMGKVYYRHKILGEEFKPLQPKSIYKDLSNNKITIQFLVPKLPLVFDEKILPKETDYGFLLYNNGVRLGISDIKIVGDCVEIYTNTALTGEVEISYAGASTSGNGNLRDNDDYEAAFNYVDIDEKDGNGNYIYSRYANTSLRSAYEPKDENGNVIYGKKYPLYNFSVAFYYKLGAKMDKLDVNFGYLTEVPLTKENGTEDVFFSGKKLYVRDNATDINDIKIFNMSGKTIINFENNSYVSGKIKTYDLAKLSPGIYIVHVNKKERSENIKLIIN